MKEQFVKIDAHFCSKKCMIDFTKTYIESCTPVKSDKSKLIIMDPKKGKED